MATGSPELISAGWIDPRSSGPLFDGWRDAEDIQPPAENPPTVVPRTWLLATGWRRHGLILVDEVPAAAGLMPAA